MTVALLPLASQSITLPAARTSGSQRSVYPALVEGDLLHVLGCLSLTKGKAALGERAVRDLLKSLSPRRSHIASARTLPVVTLSPQQTVWARLTAREARASGRERRTCGAKRSMCKVLKPTRTGPPHLKPSDQGPSCRPRPSFSTPQKFLQTHPPLLPSRRRVGGRTRASPASKPRLLRRKLRKRRRKLPTATYACGKRRREARGRGGEEGVSRFLDGAAP